MYAIRSYYGEENGKCIATDMALQRVGWMPAEKGPGSRKHGWQTVRELFEGALPGKNGPRERPGLYLTMDCPQAIITLPSLPRSNKDPDDVDTNAEDHIGDAVRYRAHKKTTRIRDQGF